VAVNLITSLIIRQRVYVLERTAFRTSQALQLLGSKRLVFHFVHLLEGIVDLGEIFEPRVFVLVEQDSPQLLLSLLFGEALVL
jgi:hypothetical protein